MKAVPVMNGFRLDLSIDASLAQRIARVIANELYLADCVALVARRNPGRPSLVDLADLIGNWARRHVEDLAPAVARYGARTGSEAQASTCTSALPEARRGPEGLVRDLQELHLLTGDIECDWRLIGCAAVDVSDDDLCELAEDAIEDARRERDWMESLIREVTLETWRGGDLTASPAAPRSLVAVRARPGRAFMNGGLLRAARSPLLAALAILFVGALFASAQHPWIAATLAPTACIIALAPTSRAARFYSVVMGHLLALAIGFSAVAFLRIAWLPGIAEAIHAGAGLPIARISASVSGILFLVFLMIHLGVDQAPAAGTLLAVTLGLVRDAADGAELAAATILLATFGGVLRRSRSLLHSGAASAR